MRQRKGAPAKAAEASQADAAVSSPLLPSSSASSPSSSSSSSSSASSWSASYCARSSDPSINSVARIAARFYIISKPFWCADKHAPGFKYYEGDDETGSSNGGEAAGGAAAAALSASASASPSQPHFKHTTLNSPALIPRAGDAARASSADATTGGGVARRPSQINIQAIDAANRGASSSSSSASSAATPPSSTRVRAASWRNLWHVNRRVYSFFHRSPRRIAWSWSILMVALLLVCTYLHVLMSYCQRNMSTSLAARDADAFYSSLWVFLATIMLASPLLSLSQYAKSQLAVHWRIYLTNQLLQQYFYRRNYFYLQPGNMAGAGAAAAAALEASLAADAALDAAEKVAAEGGGKKKKSKGSKGSSSSSSSSSSGVHIDNPDQRLCDDIRAFTRSSPTFVNELLDELFQVAAFAGILYSISPMLVLGLLLYASLGTYLATAVFGIKLIGVNSKQSKLEADFRFGLVRVRTNAEAIAFYSGENAELSYIYWRFSKIVRNLSDMAGIQMSLALFKHAYGFATMLIPPFVLAPMYFRGQVELGVISQSSMAFRQIFNSLNMVVSKMNELSKWRSGMERIWEIQESLNTQDRIAIAHAKTRRESITLERRMSDAGTSLLPTGSSDETQVSWSAEPPSNQAPAYATIQMRPSVHLRLEHLRVCVQGDPSDASPTAANGSDSSASAAVARGERILVQNLSLFLPSLQHLPMTLPLEGLLPPLLNGGGARGLLVMGRSGIGKSTLLRAIAGLWKNGSGTIHRPDLSSLLFLPQRPYMILGTLRQQLLYPFCPQNQTSGQTTSAASSAAAATTATVLRRRWPQQQHLTSALLSPPLSPSSTSSSSSSSSSGVLCSSPAPPTSSSTLQFGPACDLEGMPSDADLEYILSIVNLAHLTRAYQTRGKEEAQGEAPLEGEKAPAAAASSSSTIAGLDVLLDWSEVLSLGESQRIAFARILIHQPAFCFCDEVTAALDAHNEEKLYSALATYAPRTCLVSVGHRPALLRHHSHVLHLQEGGRWQLLEINDKNKDDIDRITALTTNT